MNHKFKTWTGLFLPTALARMPNILALDFLIFSNFQDNFFRASLLTAHASLVCKIFLLHSVNIG